MENPLQFLAPIEKMCLPPTIKNAAFLKMKGSFISPSSSLKH